MRVTELGFTNFDRREIPPKVIPVVAPYEKEIDNVEQQLPQDSVESSSIESLSASKIESGTIISKQITLGILDGVGDSFIASGKIDFTNAVNGFILGIDDSDGNKPKLYLGNSTDYLNWDGSNLTLSGALTASYINIPDATTADSFHVDSSGNVWLGCNVASFESDINNAVTYILKDGSIKTTSITIIGGEIKTGSVVEEGQDGVIMDTNGLRGYSSTLGKVFDIPTDGTAPTFASGTIEETIFEINTNAVLRTSSTVGDGSADSAGILINNTGFYACESNQLLADANVKILIDGSATISASIKGGKTDYATGGGYFLGYSGGAWKLDVGTSDNYMRWDGSNLFIKGNLDLTSAFKNISYTVANLPIPPTTEGFNSPSANA